MKEVALRYSNTRLSELVFDENATNQNLFECVKVTDWVVNKSEEGGVLLNGRRYSHQLYSHKEIEVTISANEIDEEVLGYLQNYWGALYKYIAIYNNGNWSNYTEVATESGKLPITYVDDIRDLREVSLNLITAEAL